MALAVTLRNRRFLRAYTPATPSIELQPAILPSPLETVRTASQSASPLERLAEESSHPLVPPPDCQERPIPPPPAAAPRGVPTVYPPLPTPESPTPAVDTPSDHEPSGSPLQAPCRSRNLQYHKPWYHSHCHPTDPSNHPRERRPPKRFEPETGLQFG